MEHPFQSCRSSHQQTLEALDLVAALRLLATAEASDVHSMRCRKVRHIACDSLRGALLRCGGALGHALEDIADAARCAPPAPEVCAAYDAFLSAASAWPKAVDPFLSSALGELETRRDTIERLEDDGTSSSYSDYSPSDTSTSDESRSASHATEEETTHDTSASGSSICSDEDGGSGSLGSEGRDLASPRLGPTPSSEGASAAGHARPLRRRVMRVIPRRP